MTKITAAIKANKALGASEQKLIDKAIEFTEKAKNEQLKEWMDYMKRIEQGELTWEDWIISPVSKKQLFGNKGQQVYTEKELSDFYNIMKKNGLV